MEGLEISEVLLSKIAEVKTFRFDSEYNLKEYLKIIKVIENKQKFFTSFSSLQLLVDASAFYPSLEPYYNTGTLPFLRVADVDTHINYETCIKIPDTLPNVGEFKTLNVLAKGDIVITKGGSIARIGLVDREVAVTRDLIFINSSKLSRIDYTFLFFYLLSYFSNKLLVRSSSMTAQPHLTITLFRDLPIFCPNDDFKTKVVDLFDIAQTHLTKSKALYTQAEDLLLETLDLKDFKPSEEKINIKSFSESFASTGRLDAEYYLQAIQTDEVKDHLKANTQEAADRGAFGAPTFFVGDEMFFGQDRLHFVEEALAVG